MRNDQERDMDKVYDPKQVEESTYKRWEEEGYFHAEPNPDKEPFTIVIPPPNITGQLHMGHALDETMQDIIIRFKKLQGYETLWMPGTDHASIATEVKIVEQMASEGITKQDVGREGFLERAWDWKKKYGSRITTQLKKLGSACDWERERFTLDEGCTKAVRYAFVDLHKRGLIFQGNRIINWCPECKTALSDAEVEFEEQKSHLWHVCYKTEDGTGGITVATTRPETMFGDVAVAVHPDDARYKEFIGKNIILPLLNKPIPVIADEYVEMEFGTGALKITPAHDPNDFEVGLRHKLDVIRVMNDDGTINAMGGEYCGLERYEARKKVVEDLEKFGNLIKIENHTHNVGACYRCGTTVEPIVSKQWFVSMKPLAKEAIEVVRNGKIEFVPPRFSKTYFNWMENIRDWCISRQLWWGHRIPAYYCGDCGEVIVEIDAPETCPKCGSKQLTQDEDVLDTWFSSGLWPFSTLGWPDKTPEIQYFYPTNVLVTAYDIIFFWVARMIVFGLSQMDEIPFSKVLIHGLVRDSQGRKMSKSLGNGIDPLEIIEKFGADSLRLSLVMGNAPGNDMRFYEEKVEACRNFANKIWNASRFVMMNVNQLESQSSGNFEILPVETIELDIADKWLIAKLDACNLEVTHNLNEYDLGLAAQKLYDFVWNEFCDWYIEMAKPRLYGESEEAKQDVISVLVFALTSIVTMLHPFMPFISEEIYTHLPNAKESLLVCQWPAINNNDYCVEAEAMQGIMDMIKGIRNMRSQMNVVPSKRTKLYILANDENAERIAQCEAYLIKLAYATEIEIVADKNSIHANSNMNMVSVATPFAEVLIPLDELVDIAKEIERLQKEQENWENEIKRAENKLANKGFVDKAPEKVVLEVKNNLDKYKDMLDKVLKRLGEMSQ